MDIEKYSNYKAADLNNNLNHNIISYFCVLTREKGVINLSLIEQNGVAPSAP